MKIKRKSFQNIPNLMYICLVLPNCVEQNKIYIHEGKIKIFSKQSKSYVHMFVLPNWVE